MPARHHKILITMTYEQATQRILEKALSLTSGWSPHHTDHIGSWVTDYYHNDALPGAFLVNACNFSSREPTTSTALRTSDDNCCFIASSDALTAHLEVVRQSIADEQRRTYEDKIIEIASKLTP